MALLSGWPGQCSSRLHKVGYIKPYTAVKQRAYVLFRADPDRMLLLTGFRDHSGTGTEAKSVVIVLFSVSQKLFMN